ESILRSLLERRHLGLATHLLEGLLIRDPFPSKELLVKIDIESVESWLDWIHEVDATSSDAGFFFCDRLGRFLVSCTSSKTHELLLTLFNAESSRYRTVLATYVLPKMRDLTSEVLSEDAI